MKLFTPILALVLASQAMAVTVKIMPFGASIVGAPGCWRALLWQKLQAAHINNTDFVGSMPTPDCGFKYDGENEGHAGALATDYAKYGNLTRWLAAATPDVVLMHVGTNDIIKKKSTEDIIKAYDVLVDEMRASKDCMQIIVSTLIPITPQLFGAYAPAAIIDLNAAIKQWAPTKNTEKSPIYLVDMWTGFNATTDTKEGEHPNDEGNKIFANRFYSPTVRAIDAVDEQSQQQIQT